MNFPIWKKNVINLNLLLLKEWRFVSQILLTAPINALPKVFTFVSGSKDLLRQYATHSIQINIPIFIRELSS